MRTCLKYLAFAVAPVVAAGVAQGAAVVFPVSSGGSGHAYEVVSSTTVDHAGADSAAAAAGGYLVTITSPAEQAFVQSLLVSSSASTGGYWMGLERTGTSNRLANDFQWNTGEAFTYANFATNEPNDFLALEDFSQIYWTQDIADDTNSRRGDWNDAPATGYTDSPVPDLVTGGFVIERVAVAGDGGGDGNAPPVAIPLPPAVLAAPIAMAIAGFAARRRRVSI